MHADDHGKFEFTKDVPGARYIIVNGEFIQVTRWLECQLQVGREPTERPTVINSVGKCGDASPVSRY